MKKSRYVLKSLSLCNKVLSYLSLSNIFNSFLLLFYLSFAFLSLSLSLFNGDRDTNPISSMAAASTTLICPPRTAKGEIKRCCCSRELVRITTGQPLLVSPTPPCVPTQSDTCVPAQDSPSRLPCGLHNPRAQLVLAVGRISGCTHTVSSWVLR